MEAIVLVLMLLVFFGMIAGVKADRVVTTFLNLLVQLVVVIGEVLIKIAIPALKVIGEKIVYTANHYLAESQKQKPQIAQENPGSTSSSIPTSPGPDGAGKVEQPVPKQEAPYVKPKTSSANPYDDPPEPEIMD
ncbi:hypothetical protein BH10CYA1_BH10CYA1_59960 [soil metagenome]